MSKSRTRSRKRSVSGSNSFSKKKSKQNKKPNPKLYKKTFSSWYQNESPKNRQIQDQILRKGLKDVRRIYSNFDPLRGFDARFLKHWPDARIEELRGFIRAAHLLTSGEFHDLYQLVRPRTAAQEAALRLHTGQTSKDPARHPQRAYAIYPNTRGARVEYVVEDVSVGAAMGRPIYERRVRAEIRQPVRDGVLVHRDYLFREVLGFQPGVESTSVEGLRAGRLLGTLAPWDQMVRAMEMLVPRLPARTRVGDEAHYRLLTPRGPIGRSVPRHMLVSLMQHWGDQYDPNFVEALIGVRYQGSEFAARESDRKTDKRRVMYKEHARQERLQRARITRTGELHPVSKLASKKKSDKKKLAKKKQVVRNKLISKKKRTLKKKSKPSPVTRKK